MPNIVEHYHTNKYINLALQKMLRHFQQPNCKKMLQASKGGTFDVDKAYPTFTLGLHNLSTQFSYDI